MIKVQETGPPDKVDDSKYFVFALRVVNKSVRRVLPVRVLQVL